MDALFHGRTRLSVSSAPDSDDTAARLLRGGYPEALARATGARRRAWFNAYITTILQRDVRDLAHVEGLAALPRLLSLLAARVGARLNHAEVSRGLGMPQTTLKRYRALMETTFLIQLLPAWSGNLGKRLVKSPKLYLSDTGMAAAILGIGDPDALRTARVFGPLLENFVVAELLKQSSWSDVAPALYHFRTQIGQAVDIVLEAPSGELAAVEIKASTSIGRADLAGMRAFAQEAGKRFRRGVILYQGREIVPFDRNLVAAPVEAIWRT